MNGPKVPEPSDPLEIVGVVLDRPMDEEAVEEMARTFVEEFALMGWPAKRILGMFHTPFYAGAHAALHRLGEERVMAIVQQVAGPIEGGR